jgi:hypothetical protein
LAFFNKYVGIPMRKILLAMAWSRLNAYINRDVAVIVIRPQNPSASSAYPTPCVEEKNEMARIIWL